MRTVLTGAVGRACAGAVAIAAVAGGVWAAAPASAVPPPGTLRVGGDHSAVRATVQIGTAVKYVRDPGGTIHRTR